MDSLTQAALGAAVGQLVAGRRLGPRAALVGAACACLPDLDVLIPYDDPVARMTYHRGWSHSLFWLTLAAPLIYALATRWRALRDGGWVLALAIWLALVTHPLLDAFTVYGTQLWRPFSSVPVSIGSVFIIDPLVTALLLFALWPLVRRRLPSHRRLGVPLALASAYLLAGAGVQAMLEQRSAPVLPLAQTDAIKALPTPFNAIRWRLLARGEGALCDQFLYAWQAPTADRWRCRSRGNALAAPLQDHWPVARLDWFSKGWVRYERVDDALVMRDVRMGVPGYYVFSFAVGTFNSETLSVQPTRQIAVSTPPTAQWWRAYRHARAGEQPRQ